MLTAKEKAKELVNSFYQPLGYLKCGVNNTIMWEHAKQCALIAVDEIIEVINKNTLKGENHPIAKHYKEVRKEIELL